MSGSNYDDSNVFAQVLRKELEAEIQFENENAIVIKDKYPNAPIHNLVLCKGSYEDFRVFCNKASMQEKLDFLDAICHELNRIEGGARVQMNIGEDGGQVIFHLHAHVSGNKQVDE